MRLWYSLALVLCTSPLNARLWANDSVPTTQPTAEEASTTGKVMKMENVTEVGAEIINVTSEIQKPVEIQDQKGTAVASTVIIATTPGILKEQGPTRTGNDQSLLGMLDDSGSGGASGLGSEFTEDVELEKTTNPTITLPLREFTTSSVRMAGTVSTFQMGMAETSTAGMGSPECLPRGSDWPFCSAGAAVGLSVPNFLNHTRAEQVVAVLHEWAWLLRSDCHHGLEWFFCLLVAPECPLGRPGALAGPLPCRGFCELLLDSCWTELQEKALPVVCHALPEGTELGTPCVHASNRKGKAASPDASETGDAC